jgi:hypothetical protein
MLDRWFDPGYGTDSGRTPGGATQIQRRTRLARLINEYRQAA